MKVFLGVEELCFLQNYRPPMDAKRAGEFAGVELLDVLDAGFVKFTV